MAATILITGTNGLVGFRILTTALEAGHNVRFAVRSEDKARIVSSNPAVQKLAPGDRLSAVVIPDFTIQGAFDSALEGVTHIIHTGSPVPMPWYDPYKDIFEPTRKMCSNILSSALKTPGIKSVVITSSIVGNLGSVPPAHVVSAATRLPLPDPIPQTFKDGYEAYIIGKIVQLHDTDTFVREKKPPFGVANIVPGYVYGRNELALTVEAMGQSNSSNNAIIQGVTGGEMAFPVHMGFVHIDDIAEIHLRAAFLDREPNSDVSKDFGVARKVDYDTVWGYVEKAFPKAIQDGVLKKGNVPSLDFQYDSSDAEKLMDGKLKSFETAVLDVVGQYLEVSGREKA
ncbi:putative cinnamoyl-CoA reductase [Annulohypoxylon maeteangense]|uniref:putative cinnamoyl-CoA reductase n=1 Tax=Annulohypoxylon maeteangense TaxID=1927788 RepID=UPI00200776ED|nr:putative cinnamoyl-CoA reductase [Annulohypoxylon maeteangense]KAI0885400.1 putative cinnamoyl-CoA reductase [Annulohypoxylon maeteangense]